MLFFKTEFEIDLQKYNEESYMSNIYNALEEIMGEPSGKSEKTFKITYLPKTKGNLIDFEWSGNINPNIIPKGILKTFSSPREISENFLANNMSNLLKKDKWLRKHNIRNITTIFN